MLLTVLRPGGMLSRLQRQILATVVFWGLGNPIAIAQMIPDNSLGTESSEVVPISETGDVITGGARRGGNLFHSFREFNIEAGRGGYFLNPSSDIRNILARVTGSSRSQILGELGILNAPGVTSNPTLFLLNPNGIVFGPNASLNVGGAFVASTADAIRLGDRGEFNATAPETSNLLSIDPSALLFAQLNPQSIVSRGNLGVPDGRSLWLIGGDVSLEGGAIIARDGQLAIGAVGGQATIELTDGLSFPSNAPRADVTLSNGAIVGVIGDRGGRLNITARNIQLVQGSAIGGGINGVGSTTNQAEAVTLDATDTIRLQGSGVVNGVTADAVGNAGEVRVRTNSLILTDGAVIGSSSAAQGNAGNVTIDANRIVLNNSAISSGIETGGNGSGGNIRIATETLSLVNGSRVSAELVGQGEAGNVTIDAGDRIVMDGVNSIGQASSILSSTFSGTIGNAGNVRIRTGSLLMSNGAALVTATAGNGNAGDVTITARDRVHLDGSGSGIAASVRPSAIGNAGDVTLRADSLSITNGAALGAVTAGQGNGGNVTITTRDRILLSDLNNDLLTGGIGNGVQATGMGNGGNIRLSTNSLTVRDNASLATTTEGQGNAGSIFITARDRIRFANGGNAVSGVIRGSRGNAGNIRLQTTTLEAVSGGRILAATDGTGDAGNITIEASDRVEFDSGAVALSSSGLIFPALGNAGNIRIDTGSLAIRNQAQLAASVILGQGTTGDVIIRARDSVVVSGNAVISVRNLQQQNAGNLDIQAESIQLDDGAVLNGASNLGRGGNIQLEAADSLVLRRNSSILATSDVLGNEGNIGIRTNFLVAVPTEDSDIVAVSRIDRGEAGNNIDITAQGIYGTEYRPILTPGSDITATGTVSIVLPDVDPSRSLVALPVETVDASGLIAQRCPTGSNRSGEFVVTGRGGLPPTPNQLPNTEAITSWVTPSPDQTPAASLHPIPPQAIVEAQGWVQDASGQVRLVAETPSSHQVQLSNRSIACPAA